MERGEVWWALIDQRCPVVLLSGGQASEIRAMQIVSPATADERRGFLLLSGEEATDPSAIRRAASAGADVRAMGVEVEIGTAEGLPHEGVVRVALPRAGHIFCTWLVTLSPDYLIERAGALSSTTLHQLENALQLAGIE